MLGNNKDVGLDCYGKDCILPFVDCGEFIDIVIELSKYGVKVWGLFAKQKDENGGVVMESIGLYIVKQLLKIFIDL